MYYQIKLFCSVGNNIANLQLEEYMIDKGKYSSHGVFIKKINQNYLGKWDKPKNALINPLPQTKPKQKSQMSSQQSMTLASKAFNAKFKFQQPIIQKPIPQNLIQPFLYIEKVIKKQKIYCPFQIDSHKKGKYSNQSKNVLKPFVTSHHANRTASAKPVLAPPGYQSLYQFETDKRNIANLIFQKMLQQQIGNVKDLFHLWNKNQQRNLSPDININQQQFIQFIKQLIPNKVTASNIKHFFKHYHNQLKPKPSPKALKQKPEQPTIQKFISIKVFAFNYQKFKKSQTQITNILSEIAAKDRYNYLKKYVTDFLSIYHQLKIGMKSMKQYQQTLRKHFKRLYQLYKNPFQQQIKSLKSQLQKPIIKYDMIKKQQIQHKISSYEQQNNQMYSKLTDDYTNFITAYQQAIVRNHDLFFTKRTISHLLLPIISQQPLINRQMIQQQTAINQSAKHKYLQILSEIVMQLQNDKKHLNQNCFTLGQIVQLVNMKYRSPKSKKDQQEKSLTIQSLKKIIKQIKRQFLTKFNLTVDDPDKFPADQQIPLQILHTCFQMQCTKVLFKNKIWTQLLQMIPIRTIQSKFHQKIIDANTCQQYLIKYFTKLDQRLKLELNKSKQISLLVENAYNQNFSYYADLIWKIIKNVDHYVQGQDQELALPETVNNKKKKVQFLDSKIPVEKNQQENMQMAKSVIKLIHQGAEGKHITTIPKNQQKQAKVSEATQRYETSPKLAFENLRMLKSMAKSYFEPQAMNTNAFDIRFYQKMAQQEKKNKAPEQTVIQLGSSMILSGAPRVEQLQGNDPLRISRFLLKTIDKEVQEQQKAVHSKQYQRDIYEGVSNNYYRQKIKIQNRKARYDSQGKTKYGVMLPVGYYESYIVGQSVPDNQKWYLRPHHVQTLTQNPLSKKDNIIQTQYHSKLQKLGLKKRPDQFIIEENVKRKSELIGSLQQRIEILKKQVGNAKRKNDAQGEKVNPNLVDKYYVNITQGKQDKQLQLAAYEGVLYDLRKKQRTLLNQYRGNETRQQGQPGSKWWQKRDKDFNLQFKKDRQILQDSSGVHRNYIQKLKNNEVY